MILVYRVYMKKFNWFYWFEYMTGASLIIKAYGNFSLVGMKKMKFFNEWFIELRVPQSLG